MTKWDELNREIVRCERCPRLREHCRKTAETRRRAYTDWEYWGRPVPNFGKGSARLLIVGLAPGAHGANRTGRMFTGDRSGDWLYRALHKAGFANQAEATDLEDGLKLNNCAIAAACHCAPPDNKPSKEEMEHCREWLKKTIDLSKASVFVALGQIAWKALVKEVIERSWYEGRQPKFAHAAKIPLTANRWLIGSYHPSQQNTFTGRLTELMLDSVFQTAKKLLM